MDFENRIVIQRSRDDVFAFIADFTHMPLWNYYVVETRQLSAGAPRIGTRYFQRRKTDTQYFSITEYQPNRLVAIQLERPTLPVEIRFTLEETAHGAELIDEWRLWPHMPIPRMIAQRIMSPIQQAVAENLGKLKQLLETGRAELQDGRVVRLA
jgi:polyketide cyclase/dehydrase/lipid transport protein